MFSLLRAPQKINTKLSDVFGAVVMYIEWNFGHLITLKVWCYEVICVF
jgi:hypothetical protein